MAGERTTGRTLDYLRKLGFLAASVERPLLMKELMARQGKPYNGPPVIHQDLFGIADVLACHPVFRITLLVQCTTANHMADRLAKAKKRRELAQWLKAGNKFEIWGWYRHGAGWDVKRLAVAGQDLVTVLTTPRKRAKKDRQPGLFDGVK